MPRTLAGYALGATALVACPCHLPLTLPLLLAVLSGTALGPFLADNPGLVFLGAGVYFLLALAGAFWFLSRRSDADTAAGGEEVSARDACCPPASPRSRVASGERPKVASRG